ncbi:MAG: glycoside hydrolase family 97 N-terminal domain-containing protein [Bacteroidaceae bacterium]|nr:glycoside hydrolase family 97 N-terminal domain-containing protein [Bacteroidaceae bacterium]
MKKYVLLLLCVCSPFIANAQYTVSSPDNNVNVSINMVRRRNVNTKMMVADGMRINVTADGKTVVKNREVGLELYSGGKRMSFGKADVATSRTTSVPVRLAGEDYDVLSILGDRYNSLILESVTGAVLEIRVFDDGVAYRYSVSGMEDEYKILNVCNVFPNDKPNAILGTFEGDKVLPWRMMTIDNDKYLDNLADDWRQAYPSNKIVSWRDALSSVSVGFTTNWIDGDAWGEVCQSNGAYVDFTYKYLYAGLGYTPCHELLYIYYDEDFDPFIRVIGPVHSWDMTGRLGFNLPVQNGYDVWNFAPYATASYLALRQHGPVRRGYKEVQNKNHTLLGLGLKVQYMMRERISLGVGYEYQFFTGSKEPKGRNSLIISMGFCL